MKKLVAFGSHNKTAPRHWNLSREYKESGYEIVECHASKGGILRKNWDLWRQFRRVGHDADTVLVTFPGHYFLPLAWLLTRFPRKRLVFDIFISLWDILVFDRKKVSRRSPYALFLYCLDWMDCHLADEVLIDTEAHRQFLIQTFYLKPERVRVSYVSTRTDLFTPGEQKKRGEIFEVLFYGTFIPHQGIEHILHAAAILEREKFPVHFRIIGGGQTSKQMYALAEELKLTSVSFEKSVPFEELPVYIRASDLCLGVFGTAEKVDRVIPHKVFDAVACDVPVLTAESRAVREKFTEGKDVFFVPPGDPEAIANSIKKILMKE